MIVLQTGPQTPGKSSSCLLARAFLSRPSRDRTVRLLLAMVHFSFTVLNSSVSSASNVLMIMSDFSSRAHGRQATTVFRVERVGILRNLAVLPPCYLVSELD
jgi:hypothetical protein